MPHSSFAPDPGGARATRRAFLGRASSTAFAASLSGALGALLSEAPAGAAVVSTAGTEALTGLLAYAVPGNDAYSRQQGVTADGPGAADPAQRLTRVLAGTLDAAPHVAIPGVDITLPGGAAIAAWIDLTALVVSPPNRPGPFGSPFANLSWERKARVLKAMETNRAYRGTPLCWVANQLSLLAAFTAFGEGGVRVGRTSQLVAQPVGWQITGWTGPRDGAPERRGYYRGRTAAER